MGEDATSQLRTIFNQQPHLFLPCILTQPFYFRFVFLYFRRFSPFVPSTKNGRLIRLSFASAPLCQFNLPSRIHTTTTHKQASKHFNQQSVTKDNRLEEQSPCRRHCLSVVSNVRSRSRVRFATIELESYVGVVATANVLTDLLVRARERGMNQMTDRREYRVTRRRGAVSRIVGTLPNVRRRPPSAESD